jgi:archaeal cell division control protein 6
MPTQTKFMGSLFDSILSEDQTLFKNELALSYEFVPKLVPYRENQQKRIASCITPLFSEHTGRNIVVFGPPGVGKTVAAKHILQELEEKTQTIVPLYVNCWAKNTSYKVMLAICELLEYKFTVNKKTDELFDIIATKLHKNPAVFVFDEIDKAEDVDFLYLILSKLQHKSIILLTNHKEFITLLDMRIRSRLTPELLEFAPYTQAEITGILTQRRELAFYPKVWEQQGFEKICTKAFELKDLRMGLYLVKESALCAQETSSKIIAQTHVEIALKKLEEFKIKSTTDLADETKEILTLIKVHASAPIKIGELYKKYQSTGGHASYKTFSRKIAKLQDGKFITVQKISGGTEGTTSLISYNTSEQPEEKTDLKISDFS